MNFYDFTAKKDNGQIINLNEYKGKPVVIVCSDSETAYRPEYKVLQEMINENDDLIGLIFPSDQINKALYGKEFKDGEEIDQWPGEVTITMPVFKKAFLNGPKALPLFKWLKDSLPFNGFNNNLSGFLTTQLIKWTKPDYLKGNDLKGFTYFLIDKKGNPVKRLEMTVNEKELREEITTLLE